MIKDNPQVTNWSQGSIYSIPFSKNGVFKKYSLNNILIKDLELSLSGLPLRDISALQGIPLIKLDLFHTEIKDLSVLNGMSLKYLNLGSRKPTAFKGGMVYSGPAYMRPNITDISPLRGMPLERLIIYSSSLKDISSLKGMPLKYLDLYSPSLKDISSLKGMPLEYLDLAAKIIDISVLKKMPLKHLSLSNIGSYIYDPMKGLQARITDISVLKEIPLRSLNIEYTTVIDISMLEGMPLEKLFLPVTAKNIEFLRSMKTLKMINYQSPQKFWKLYDKTGEMHCKKYRDNGGGFHPHIYE
ncbi:MAG: hypothetical protein MJH11_16100 [Lentisphaeria bacterium]|nr:hypothetical protein [Lentisphaeria bacterium]